MSLETWNVIKQQQIKEKKSEKEKEKARENIIWERKLKESRQAATSVTRPCPLLLQSNSYFPHIIL